MTGEGEELASDITVKEAADEPTIRGEGFAYIDLPQVQLNIALGEDVSPGELEVSAWDDEVVLTFMFDDLGAEFPHPEREMGFSLDADGAESLADWLHSYAEYARSGEWTHPEAEDAE